MSNRDTSYTQRLRILKARTIAIYDKELNVKYDSESTALQRKLGDREICDCSSGPTGFLRSKGNTTDGGNVIGESVTKDMAYDSYTLEFNPYNYQNQFFPGMADFVDGNIVAGDKSEESRLNASYWDDLGDDIFDDWGFFYLYDVESGQYYFPLLYPRNEDDGVLTTQTFNAFDRIFTIVHGWSVQGIFKIDISVADEKPFRFGSYGNMGSDEYTLYEDLNHVFNMPQPSFKLHYLHNKDMDEGYPEELYIYYVPKKLSDGVNRPYDAYYDSDNMNIVSKPITNGVIVYYAKGNDAKDWVINDLEMA